MSSGKGSPEWMPVTTLLDQFTQSSIRETSDAERRIREFHWSLYSDLAQRRREARSVLRNALLEAALGPREFSNWYRLVRYRWSNSPLGLGGSVKGVGNRFNMGAMDASVPVFPALYVAEETETAIAETIGQEVTASDRLNRLELALAKPDSFTVVRVSARVETHIDLAQPQRLESFVALIRDFRISSDVRKLATQVAKDLGTTVARVTMLVRSTDMLLWTMLHPNWREFPIQLGIPSVSQIFGQLVQDAGIEAILYPSKFQTGQCMAVFPQVFSTDAANVTLMDEPPGPEVIKRLDRATWERLMHRDPPAPGASQIEPKSGG